MSKSKEKKEKEFKGKKMKQSMSNNQVKCYRHKKCHFKSSYPNKNRNGIGKKPQSKKESANVVVASDS